MRAREFIIEGYKEVTQKYIDSGVDPVQVKNSINKFKEIVNRNQAKGDQKNIDWWGKNKSFDEFDRFVKSIDLERTKTQVKRQKVVGDSINLLENDEWLVVIPLTKDASCFHGKSTNWCTAKPNQKYFHEYFGKGITLIYCINKKTGDKWAIAASPRYDDKMELFDKNDKNLTKEQFQQQTGMNPIDLVELAANHDTSIKQGRKNSTMHDPESAYYYARDVIGGRWPEGEKVIASDPSAAAQYARDVIGGRWPEGEEIIKTDPEAAFMYAVEVIKGPWPEGEDSIGSDIYTALNYADFIKARFRKGERVIASEPYMSHDYARTILKDPDPETWAKRYLSGRIR